MADTQLGSLYGSMTRPNVSVRGWTGFVGAATSLALVVGVGVWGWQLILRDVNGVPVIRSMEGPMRVQPVDAQGTRMPHQGLSVNEVAAAGEAGQVADALVLAPDAPGLRDHDLPVARLPDRPLVAAAPPSLADQIEEAVSAEAGDAGIAPGGEAVEPTLAAAVVSAPLELIPASVPGVSKSPRPPARPPHIQRTSPAPGTEAELRTPAQAPAAAPVEIDADTLPVGSRLVQLGTFDTQDLARAEWDAMSQRFAEVMRGKSRVIQQASSNGSTFYRLRVAGFGDLADARRFCATLVADKSKPLCVPVATR